MSALDFEFDWMDAEGVQGPELATTWASLTIRAGTSSITKVQDARTVRDFVQVPLYPLAEWLASNWWFLTREIETPIKRDDPAFRHRHTLGPAREGYAFPDLEVVPSGTRTRIRWTSGSRPRTSVTFLGNGTKWMDSGDFQQTCADFIDCVLRRLAALGVDGTFLQDEWTAVQAADHEEAALCGASAGLGWDPYALDDERREMLLQLAETLGDLLDEAVPVLDGNDPRAGGTAIVTAIADAKRNTLPLERLRRFRNDDEHSEGASSAASPWQAGYEWARRFRKYLNLNGAPLPTSETLADALGEDRNALQHVMAGENFGGATLIDGVVTRSDDACPAFAFSKCSHHRRFAFCRALAEVLARPASDALLTQARSERQKRNRAFAAEFLAPSSELQQRVSHPVLDGADINELAEEFGVSSWVIQHQIENHHIARVL